MSFKTVFKLFLSWEYRFEDFINLKQYYAFLVNWKISLAICIKHNIEYSQV